MRRYLTVEIKLYFYKSLSVFVHVWRSLPSFWKDIHEGSWWCLDRYPSRRTACPPVGRWGRRHLTHTVRSVQTIIILLCVHFTNRVWHVLRYRNIFDHLQPNRSKPALPIDPNVQIYFKLFWCQYCCWEARCGHFHTHVDGQGPLLIRWGQAAW